MKLKGKATLKRAAAQDAQALGMSEADEDFFFAENKQDSKRRKSKESFEENHRAAGTH